jgi:hypothetical protein
MDDRVLLGAGSSGIVMVFSSPVIRLLSED